MPRKKPRTPRAVARNPIEYAIAMASVPCEADLDQLRRMELLAIDSYTLGVPDPNGLQAMVYACRSIAQEHIGYEALPYCDAAQAVLDGTSADIDALRVCYQYHDAQRTCMPRSLYEKHLSRAVLRMKGK